MFHNFPKLAIAATLLIASISAQLPSHPVRLTAYGLSCGPTLTAKSWFTSDKKPRMTFALSSKHASTLGIWFLGVQKTTLPIPNTSCSLYTMPILLFPFITNDDGVTSFETLVPNQLKKTVYMQMALFPKVGANFAIKTSNGMEITRIL